MLYCQSVVNSVVLNAKYRQNTVSSYICINVFYNKNVHKIVKKRLKIKNVTRIETQNVFAQVYANRRRVGVSPVCRRVRYANALTDLTLASCC